MSSKQIPSTLMSPKNLPLFFHIKKQPPEVFCEKRCSLRKGVLRNLAKFTRKHLCQSLFFNKVAGPTTLSKKRDWHSCFLMNFAKFLRIPFSQNTSRRLLFHNLKILFSLFERMLDQFV